MKDAIRLLAVSVALAALTVAASADQSMEFQPAEVACICGEVGGAPDVRVLLRFDLSALPDSAVVQFAGLRLADQASIPWSTQFVPVVAGALTKQWDGTAASWYTASGNQTWDNAGGDWDPQLTAYRVIVRKARAPAELLLTGLVTKWIQGDVPNYGLIVMIRDVDELADVVPYFSAESLKPVLTVHYVAP